MAIPQIILAYLREHCVNYRREEHRAGAISTNAGERPAAAKTIVFRSDDQLFMVVLNEDRTIDMDAIKNIVGCDELAVLSEKDLFERFGSCEPAAIPPFGALFHIPVYCDRTLAQESEVEFHVGTATDAIRIPFSEWLQIEAPTMADFSNPSDSTRGAA